MLLLFGIFNSAFKTFPVILIRNPILRYEFKIVSILDNVADLTVGLTFPESPDLTPRTLMMKKIDQAQNVWTVGYQLDSLPKDGVKVVATVIGRDNLGQDISPSMSTFILR